MAWIFTLYVILLQHTGSFKWNRLFGGHLSRSQRTLFDEWNVMETYQPRAWTLGHLFDPEPPTPYCSGKPSQEMDPFKIARDAVSDVCYSFIRIAHFLQHYADEFTFVQKMEAERKAREENSGNTSQQGSQQTSTSGQTETMRIELNEEPKGGDQDSYREI
ncbi:unnamed protein product [Strongylus vulgaris]|uniref:Uncharacterized protein n=1 Tax=Strongylus vulgaris TaxID=40348 RepID=A0A3P7LNJ8_STRVU|nr:unnamed protein product [Strongylus vulgaris]